MIYNSIVIRICDNNTDNYRYYYTYDYIYSIVVAESQVQRATGTEPDRARLWVGDVSIDASEQDHIDINPMNSYS